MEAEFAELEKRARELELDLLRCTERPHLGPAVWKLHLSNQVFELVEFQVAALLEVPHCGLLCASCEGAAVSVLCASLSVHKMPALCVRLWTGELWSF